MPDAPVGRGEPVHDTQLVAPTVLAPAPSPPVTAGAVVSRTLRVWWSRAGAFTAMSIVVYAPMLAGFGLLSLTVMEVSQGGGPGPGTLGARLVAGAAGTAATLVLSAVQVGAVTYGTIRHLHGERPSLGQLAGVGLRRGLPVVGTAFVLWLATAVGVFLLVVPGVMFLVAACVAIPAAVVERPGVGGAIRRSFELTRGSRWSLFAAGLGVTTIVWLLSAAVQVAAMALAAVALPRAWALGATVFASQLGTALFSVIPVVAIAVCYHDLRLAKEGADTADLARVFE